MANSIQINASIYNQYHPNTGSGTYTYNQLLFLGSYVNAQVTASNGNQTTVGEILANDLGPSNNGTLSFNFGSLFGSGTLSEDPATQFSSQSDPGEDFTFTSFTPGLDDSGASPIGDIVGFNPLDPARTYNEILGDVGQGPFLPENNGSPSTSQLNLPPQEDLGTQVSYVSVGGALSLKQ
ncbi:MAG: hypothetical protein M0Z48_02470 [Nitrospiraceae bacterium]|nr:hypothetical protein [Nitrospiraceae bacterium]